MSESNEFEIDPMPTVIFEPGGSGAMKMTMSISDGTYVWMPITPDEWERIKAGGDEVMIETTRLSPPA